MLTFILNLTIKATGGVENVADQVINTSYTGNILVALLFLVVIALYGFLLDPHNRLINLLGIYAGLTVVRFFPFGVWDLFGWQLWSSQLLIFLGIFILTAIILSLTHLFKAVYVKNFLKRWLEAVVNGFLHSGLLASSIISFLPAKFLGQFSPWFLSILIDEKARFLWVVLPLAGLLLMRHKSKVGRPPAY